MDIVWGAGRSLAAGSVEIDNVAALGPKADPGIHFPPNPLVGIGTYGIREGGGISLKCWKWILVQEWAIFLLLISRNIDIAVLGPKADSGICFPLNPLAGILSTRIRAGDGTGPWIWKLILI